MPLQATSGAASYDAFGGGVVAEPNYIESCFSTYLYTGTSASQTITNNIDLSTNGGLVWIKSRETYSHRIFDTARGVGKTISSNSTGAQFTDTTMLSAFNTTGFSLGVDSSGGVNDSGYTFASWSWAKAPKFFDVVSWSGTNADQTIAHALGQAPGMIIVKRTDATSNWRVYHRSLTLPNEAWMHLNTTDAAFASGGTNIWNATSTDFQASTYLGLSTTGGSYVAYLFAHDAGGFGLTGTDNVISCGSFSGNTTVTLGYEPQWIMLKRTDAVGNWDMHDVMRGWPVSGDAARLRANLSDAESQTSQIYPNATGFSTLIGSGNYIYIAIRRGPMKVPTSGTSVFSPVAYSGTGATRTITAGFPVDLAIPKSRGATGNGAEWYSRLIGANRTMMSSGTFAEFAIANELTSFASNTGVELGNSSTSGGTNASGSTYVDWNFQRAPSFFDEVCYTGTGVNRTVTHNLGVVPELMIVKNRTQFSNWTIYTATTGNGYAMNFDTAVPFADGGVVWNSTSPTSAVFSVGTNDRVNGISANPVYVAYLFATCAGVSKVGSYTGTGTTLQVDCGFTGGSRFVLIKRTDSTGSWYVWDVARGISSGNDPYLLLNSTAAEVTNTDYIDTYSAGFEISSTAPAEINASGGSFIFLAIS